MTHKLFLACVLWLAVISDSAAVPPAYANTAHTFGLPGEVLYGLALTESGKRTAFGFRPWPWTLNIAGQAERFVNEAAARERLQSLLDQGQHHIDVGLMQVNWFYHAQRFHDAADALNPYRNLQVAADILSEYWQDSGDLWRAIGRYHSATPERAQAYQLKFGRRLLQQLQMEKAIP